MLPLIVYTGQYRTSTVCASLKHTQCIYAEIVNVSLKTSEQPRFDVDLPEFMISKMEIAFTFQITFKAVILQSFQITSSVYLL